MMCVLFIVFSSPSQSQPNGSKRCFPNGVFQIPDLAWHRRTTSRREEKMPENAYVLKQFVRLLLFGILTTPWARHSEKHRLENTVCYSLGQRCAPAEWNLREIFCFSHRFWREILVKFSVAHPNPGKRSTEISPKFHAKFHDTSGREKRRKISLPHFCRVAALTQSP